jgi:hypothetical protein
MQILAHGERLGGATELLPQFGGGRRWSPLSGSPSIRTISGLLGWAGSMGCGLEASFSSFIVDSFFLLLCYFRFVNLISNQFLQI